MSVYATLAQFKARLGSQSSPTPGVYEQLTDRNNMSVADDTVGQELVDQAEGDINAYLGQRYQTPVAVAGNDTLATTLRKWTLTMAAYEAYVQHPVLRDPDPAVKDAYDKTISLLKRIADGVAALPGASAIPAATSSGSPAYSGGHPKKYTPDAMDGL